MGAVPEQQPFDRLWAALGLVASAAFAVLDDAAPTELHRWDAVLRVGFGLVVPLVAAGAPRWVWFGAFAVTGGFAAGPEWMIVAAFGLALAAALEVSGIDSELGRVAIGIGIAHGVLNLRDMTAFGVSAAVAGLVVGLCAFTAVAAGGPLVRRAAATFGGFAALLVVAAFGAVLVAALQARTALDNGSASARNGLDLARDGDSAGATRALTDAAARLASADRTLHAWWVEPGRLVPVVGQHLAAARVSTGPVADLVAASADAVELADVDELRLAGGAIDLASVEAMAEPLARVDSATTHAITELATVDSPWLAPPLRRRVEQVRDELVEAHPDAEKAALATRVLPGMLGSAGERRYLVMFAMPAEAREFGGIMSTYLELTANNGVITVTDQGTAGQLNTSASEGVLEDPTRFSARFLANNPERFTTNWTSMPDLPLIAEAVSSLYPGFGGRPIDGVVYVDPIGVAGLMELSGPVELTAIGQTISADNVVEFLNVGQYAIFDDQTERKEYLTDIAGATFNRLLSGDLPSPRTLGSVLGPAARGGHLQMATLDDSANEFLRSMFLLGEFPRPVEGEDFLSIVQTNGEANKIDSFLERDIDYQVRLADDGSVEATVTATLHNTATLDLPDYIIGTPPEGMPVGTTKVQLSIYTPHFLNEVRIDGVAELIEPQIELGWQRYLLFVNIPSGGSREVIFELSGRLAVDDDRPYRLVLANQALINDDEVRVTVIDADDDSLIGETELSLVEDTHISFEG